MLFTALRQKPKRHASLAGELTWVLVIKFIALFFIWLAFFAAPMDRPSVESYLSYTLFNSSAVAPDQ